MSRTTSRQLSSSDRTEPLSFSFELEPGQQCILLQSAVNVAGTLLVRALEGDVTVMAFDQMAADGGRPKVVLLSDRSPATVAIGKMIVALNRGEGPAKGEVTLAR